MLLKLILLLLVVGPYFLICAENVITCDDVQRLSCTSDGTMINVQNSLYVSTPKSICSTNISDDILNNSNCNKTITSNISDRCNGLKECEFTVDLFRNDVQCPNNYSYIYTNYSCVTGKNIVVCEDSYSSIDCGSNTISILSAMYGRTDPKMCVDRPNSNLTNCFFNATAGVAKLCNSRTSCNLYASSTIYQDLCKGTKKYLRVFYKCNKPSRIVTACEGTNANLTCGNLTIHVHSANFGRTDSTTCSDQRPVCQISSTNCYKSESLMRVCNSCEGWSHCSVPATVDSFSGDPCYGTYKYLQIVYSCK